MKILSAKQTRDADAYTIKHEPISSLDLMERAATRAAKKLLDLYPNERFTIFCGMGNNGGDGLVMARWLVKKGLKVSVYVLNHSTRASDDFKANLERLKQYEISVWEINRVEDIDLQTPGVLVDAILGSGLDRKLKGLLKEVIKLINLLDCPKVSVDIPTGLFADDNYSNDLSNVFKAHHTLTFQHPKLSFVHTKTAHVVGQFHILNIGLDQWFYNNAVTRNFFITKEEIKAIYKPREKFSYKGSYGHVLMIGGHENTAGAIMLSSEAAFRSGVGLVTVNIPKVLAPTFNVAMPEIMLQFRESPLVVNKKFSSVLCGPGLGLGSQSASLLKKLLIEAEANLVLDADALNILSDKPSWFKYLKNNTVLTPHVGEFKRLLGLELLDFNYLDQLSAFARNYKMIVVLKDTITSIADADGNLYFTDFGSPALAKAGSGDILAGVISSLLAQGYKPLEAVIIAQYLLGSASKIAASKQSYESVLARDTIQHLGAAFKTLL